MDLFSTELMAFFLWFHFFSMDNWFLTMDFIFYAVENGPFQGGTSFVDLLCFCSVLCLLCLCARLFICALWSPAGKGLTSWLSFVVSTVSLSLSYCILGQVWYLIVSIPDLCTLTYFNKFLEPKMNGKITLSIFGMDKMEH